ncbi:MAG: epoxyqueuosine reductase [Deltaproteobacteria bacterium]|nr:epoxyqueuosine reductase [Deltaproteobacteria bacterium]
MDKMERLSNTVKDLAVGGSAVAVGIATTKTLEGGPPSTDLNCFLPEARSAVVFALPLDQGAIEAFLKKEDMAAGNVDNRRTNTMASGIALEMAEYLNMKGYESVPITANAVYRKDVPGGAYAEIPPISHRYLAVRSGVGHFGISGNIIMDKYGAGTILASVLTQAELIPTDPLPREDNYCDECGLCRAACASGLMSGDEKTTVTLGGIEFSYAKRLSYSRCDFVCGGFSGLHKSGNWSTWSPARFPIPEKDEEFLPALLGAVEPFRNRIKPDFGCNIYHPLVPGNRLEFTCGHCQFICHPDKKVRQDRYKMLTTSGVAIQEADGYVKAVHPDEAREHLDKLDPETRALYE